METVVLRGLDTHHNSATATENSEDGEIFKLKNNRSKLPFHLILPCIKRYYVPFDYGENDGNKDIY